MKLIDRFNVQSKIIGILYLTAKHLVFISTSSKIELWVNFKSYFQIEFINLNLDLLFVD